jgi:hypothetical protein
VLTARGVAVVERVVHRPGAAKSKGGKTGNKMNVLNEKIRFSAFSKF